MANEKDTLAEVTEAIGEKAAETREQATEKAADLRERAAETAGELRARAAEAAEQAADKGKAAFQKASEKAADLRGQAAEKARTLATDGKDRAADALDGVTRLVDSAAGTIDEKVGEQYGAYAHRAADAVENFANTLRTRDIDELMADARDTIRRHPMLTLGAAAVVGFVLARTLKSGSSQGDSGEA